MVALRDRQQKRELERQKELRAASGTAGSVPPTAQKRQRRDSMESAASEGRSSTGPETKKQKVASPSSKRHPFTTEDLREMAKMMVEAESKGWTKGEVYAKLERLVSKPPLLALARYDNADPYPASGTYCSFVAIVSQGRRSTNDVREISEAGKTIRN